MTQIILQPTQPTPIPDDLFDLRVRVDASQCAGGVPRSLRAMQRDGLTLSFTETFTHATIYFRGRPVVRRAGESSKHAFRRKTWDLLEDWEPRVEPAPTGERRLVVNESPAGESTKTLSELLGEAMSLSVAKRVTGISFSRWSKKSYAKGTRHDFEGIGDRGKAFAEARGRFNGNNLDKAIEGVRDKFSELAKRRRARRIRSMIGVVYCLRTDPDDEQVPFSFDVEVVDPDEDAPAPRETEIWRALLAHYSTFFTFQAKRDVARALDALRLLTDRELERAVVERRPILEAPRERRPGGDLWGRTTFQIGADRYIGTIWRDRALPFRPGRIGERVAGKPVFWGIAREVAEALASCALDSLASLEAASITGQTGRYGYSYADDGTVFVFSMGDASVIDHP